MELDQQQLGAVLQPSLDKAGELLFRDGGYLPFGARVGASEMEFVQLAPDSAGEAVDALWGRLVDMLALEAQRGEIIGSALIADARLAGEDEGAGVVVLVETAGFSRSVLARYKRVEDAIEFGPLTPQGAEPAVFAG
jgi:hypothetical protein